MAQERRQRCTCGCRRSEHQDEVVGLPCGVCHCDGFAAVPAQRLPEEVAVGLPEKMELTQLRAKVGVYETRNETQVKSIEALKKELNEKDGRIAHMQRVAAGLKKVAVAHQEMTNLLVEAGRISKEFADVFLPPPTTAEDDLVEAHICEDDYCNEH